VKKLLLTPEEDAVLDEAFTRIADVLEVAVCSCDPEVESDEGTRRKIDRVLQWFVAEGFFLGFISRVLEEERIYANGVYLAPIEVTIMFESGATIVDKI